MAFKQPRVPEYRESEGTGKYLRSLVLFLKDFCNDVWTANNQRAGEIGAVKAGYPVTSVCGKTGDVALDAGDVGALATGGTAADSSKLGGKAPEYYLQPRNLLDNSDFTNLVSQSGIGGNHGTVAYAADRWILDSGTVSYEAGVGLTLSGTIRQKLELPPTGNTSAFVGMVSGEASISYADGEVTITSGGGVLKWAALYEGSYTADTLPPYVPKGYAAELEECQRYFVQITKNGVASNINYLPAHAITTSLAITIIPITMRGNPTITINNCYLRKGITDIAIDSIRTAYVRGFGLEVTFNSSGLTQGENYILRLNNGTIQLSADL